MRSASPLRPILLFAAVLGMIGAAAATTSVSISAGPDGVSVQAESDDVPKLPPGGDRDNDTRPPPPPPPKETFAINVSPSYQEAEPGATVRYVVEVHARRDIVVDLRVANVTDGFRAQLESSSVAVRANSSARVALDVQTPSGRNGTSDKGVIVVEGAARDTGEKHQATAYVSVVAAAPTLTAWLDPAQRNATRNDTVTFHLLINASHERDVVVTLANSTPGYDVQHAPTVLRVHPGRLGVVNVTVNVLPTATHDGWFTLRVETRDLDAKAHAVGHVRLYDASTNMTWSTAREAPKEEPAPTTADPGDAIAWGTEPEPAHDDPATGTRVEATTPAASVMVAVQPAMRMP